MFGVIKWVTSLLAVNTGESILKSVEESVTGVKGKDKAELLNAKAQYLGACQPFNVARRFIAIMFTFLYLLCIASTAILHYFSPEYASFLAGLAKNELQTPMNLIIGFYFAIGGVSKIGGLFKK